VSGGVPRGDRGGAGYVNGMPVDQVLNRGHTPATTLRIHDRTLRVVSVRDDDADQPPVLVVEDTGSKSH
jgi:hypothetical protein